MGLSEDLERVAMQERELQLPRLDAQVAWELGTTISDAGRRARPRVVVDVRRFGQPLFYAALDGTTPDNAEWVRRKSNVVARFHRSSYGVGLTHEGEGTTLLEAHGLPVADYAAHGGSFPLAVEGAGSSGQRDRLRPAAARRPRTGGGGAVRNAGKGFCGVEAGGGASVGTNLLPH